MLCVLLEPNYPSDRTFVQGKINDKDVAAILSFETNIWWRRVQTSTTRLLDIVQVYSLCSEDVLTNIWICLRRKSRRFVVSALVEPLPFLKAPQLQLQKTLCLWRVCPRQQQPQQLCGISHPYCLEGFSTLSCLCLHLVSGYKTLILPIPSPSLKLH